MKSILPYLLLSALLAAVVPARAVNRALSITAPAETAAGSSVTVTVSASTDEADGEQVGFLQAEYSIDFGRTWTPFFYSQKPGAAVSHLGSFAVEPKGGKALIRARAAFRGGKAGDVDFKGGAIQWGESWEKWRTPPTRYAIISVLPAAVSTFTPSVNRVLNIAAPAEAAAGSSVPVTVSASTDAVDGEQVGFLHAEYSIDEGKTWTQFYYSQKPGIELLRSVNFVVGPKGVKTLIRARAAFRGGKAGDVDVKGGAIQWDGSWEKWRAPAAKYAIIHILPAAVVPARTVNRVLSITAPVEVVAGSNVTATVFASTDAIDGEQVGLLHAEYSIDEGKTWMQFYYADKSGAELSRAVSFVAGPKGGKTLIRVRAAFRGGKAGDVDVKGGAIQWGDGWEKWRTPAAKYAVIYVAQ